MNPFLFDLPILPEGFKFPDQYLRLVRDSALPDIEPWAFLFQNKGASPFILRRYVAKASRRTSCSVCNR